MQGPHTSHQHALSNTHAVVSCHALPALLQVPRQAQAVSQSRPQHVPLQPQTVQVHSRRRRRALTGRLHQRVMGRRGSRRSRTWSGRTGTPVSASLTTRCVCLDFRCCNLCLLLCCVAFQSVAVSQSTGKRLLCWHGMLATSGTPCTVWLNDMCWQVMSRNQGAPMLYQKVNVSCPACLFPAGQRQHGGQPAVHVQEVWLLPARC